MPDALAEAVAGGVASALAVVFAPSRFTPEERARAELLERERYGHERLHAPPRPVAAGRRLSAVGAVRLLR